MEYKADRSWHKSAEQSGQVEGGEERRVGPEPGHEPLRLYVEVVGEKVEVEGEYGGDDAAEGERVERHPAGRVPGRAGVVAAPLQLWVAVSVAETLVLAVATMPTKFL